MAEFLDFDGVSSSPTATSFVTLEWAKAYVESRGGSADDWNAATDPQRQGSLISATNALNTLNFVGNELTAWQRLSWPRDIDESTYVQVTINEVPAADKFDADEIKQEEAYPPFTWQGGGIVFTEEEDANYYVSYSISDYNYSEGRITASKDFNPFQQLGDQPYLVTPITHAIKAATVELAIVALGKSTGSTSEVSEVKLGPATIKYEDNSTGSLLNLSQTAQDLIAPYLSRVGKISNSSEFI